MLVSDQAVLFADFLYFLLMLLLSPNSHIIPEYFVCLRWFLVLKKIFTFPFNATSNSCNSHACGRHRRVARQLVARSSQAHCRLSSAHVTCTVKDHFHLPFAFCDITIAISVRQKCAQQTVLRKPKPQPSNVFVRVRLTCKCQECVSSPCECVRHSPFARTVTYDETLHTDTHTHTRKQMHVAWHVCIRVALNYLQCGPSNAL